MGFCSSLAIRLYLALAGAVSRRDSIGRITGTPGPQTPQISCLLALAEQGEMTRGILQFPGDSPMSGPGWRCVSARFNRQHNWHPWAADPPDILPSGCGGTEGNGTWKFAVP
jgi:hypothetical protein